MGDETRCDPGEMWPGRGVRQKVRHIIIDQRHLSARGWTLISSWRRLDPIASPPHRRAVGVVWAAACWWRPLIALMAGWLAVLMVWWMAGLMAWWMAEWMV